MRHLLKSAAAKGFLLTVLLLFAASICRAQSAAPETPDYILRSGGMERTYKLHLPAGLPENAPLVVVLHGYGGNNNPDRFAMNATTATVSPSATRRARKTDAARAAGTWDTPFRPT